jgi:hypothetical protein
VSTAVSPLHLPPYNADGALTVVIETPKGSHNNTTLNRPVAV